MLEILGFIALVAIIFGVSMTAAVGIIAKVILWIVGIVAALYLVSKISFSTIKILAILSAAIGFLMAIGLNSYEKTAYSPCWELNNYSAEAYYTCMNSASSDIESRRTSAVWLLVIGVVVGIPAAIKDDKKNAKK